MAHWDEQRDRRWVEMMRACEVPGAEEIIRKFEETGDLIYRAQFIAIALRESRRRPEAARKKSQ